MWIILCGLDDSHKIGDIMTSDQTEMLYWPNATSGFLFIMFFCLLQDLTFSSHLPSDIKLQNYCGLVLAKERNSLILGLRGFATKEVRNIPQIQILCVYPAVFKIISENSYSIYLSIYLMPIKLL